MLPWTAREFHANSGYREGIGSGLARARGAGKVRLQLGWSGTEEQRGGGSEEQWVVLPKPVVITFCSCRHRHHQGSLNLGH